MKHRFLSAKYLLIGFIILVSSVSCRNYTEKKGSDKSSGANDMVDINRYFVMKDKERIVNYAERKNLVMSESPTGLWYMIITVGNGDTLRDNTNVVFEYDCSLLDGTKCYSSKDLGPKEIILGKTKIEPGLDEGLRLLKPGSEAVFILPPYLGYGLVGDGKLIPSRAIIVYKVNILQTK